MGRDTHRVDGSGSFELANLVTTDEMAQLAELFAPELARGWIPSRGDLEGALELVRRGPAARREVVRHR